MTDRTSDTRLPVRGQKRLQKPSAELNWKQTEAFGPKPQIPVAERRLHTLTQVCRRLGVEPHVLRYWEKEFELTVKRNSAGRRVYTDEQLELLSTIKHFIRHDKLTVKGARRQLAKMKTGPAQAQGRRSEPDLLWLKRELISIKELLGQQA